jgi:hypothetical protein
VLRCAAFLARSATRRTARSLALFTVIGLVAGVTVTPASASAPKRAKPRPRAAATTFAVGDFVWYDDNHNGIQEPDEVGAATGSVTLLTATGARATDATGAVVPVTQTDSAGHYVFDNLATGTYAIQFGAPTNYDFTIPADSDVTDDQDSDPLANGVTPTFTLAVGANDVRAVTPADGTLAASQIDPAVDAGLVALLAVGDHVFFDSNANGVQNRTDPSFSGITVSLLDAAGNPAIHADGTVVAPVLTTTTGHYVFDNLLAGEYEVQFTLPSGWTFTRTDVAGSTDANNSDANADGVTDPFVLARAGTDVTAITKSDAAADAALVPTGP